MTTPQDPARRKKQKVRRAKQLAAWRAKNPEKKAAPEAKAAAPKAATPEKKPAAAKAKAAK